MIFSGIIGDFFVVNKDVLDYNIGTKYCNDCCRNGGMIMYYTAMPAGVAIIGTIYLIFKYCKYGKDIFLGLAFSAFGFFVKVFINTFCGYCVMAMGMTLVVLTLMQMVFHHKQDVEQPTAYQKLCREMDSVK